MIVCNNCSRLLHEEDLIVCSTGVDVDIGIGIQHEYQYGCPYCKEFEFEEYFGEE